MISAACPATYVSRPRKSLPTLHAVEPAAGGDGVERCHRFADQIKCPLHLAVPQAPADVLHSIGEAGAFLPVFVRDVRPAFDCLGDMLDAHRQMEPVQYISSRTTARRLSQRPRPVGAIAEDGELRARCCAKAMQDAAQLLGLPIGLGWHAA